MFANELLDSYSIVSSMFLLRFFRSGFSGKKQFWGMWRAVGIESRLNSAAVDGNGDALLKFQTFSCVFGG